MIFDDHTALAILLAMNMVQCVWISILVLRGAGRGQSGD
jgi:hypothetical protein